MATDTVDAVIAQLKLATVFSSRVYRGWPAATTLMPDCGVSGTIDGERTIDRGLASWNVQIDSWAKSTTDIVAVEAAIRVVANKFHSVVHHREIPEAGQVHIISTFNVLGGW